MAKKILYSHIVHSGTDGGAYRTFKTYTGSVARPIQMASLENKNKTWGYYKNSKGHKLKRTAPLTKSATNYDFKRAINYSGISSDIVKEDLTEDVNMINHSLNYYANASDTRRELWLKSCHYYNRYKIPTLNTAFIKGFAHVFFTKPICNILDKNHNLQTDLKADPWFRYLHRYRVSILDQLCGQYSSDGPIMYALSNKAESFSLSDEYIEKETYGKSFSGWSITYGKNNVESKSAGTFDISYTDDRDLDVYYIHKAWAEYIAGVYRGDFNPTSHNIKAKVLDYPAACYYFVTAEDGETLVFWSKYYGVFPTTIPSTHMSWSEGRPITDPNFTQEYNFSFKEDMNPDTLIDFNHLTKGYGSGDAMPEYDSKIGFTGKTWVGPPFIELDTGNDGKSYRFKLRFNHLRK